MRFGNTPHCIAGFFVKDPMFYAESLYLKLPKRIMALIMVMTLSLLMYALAKRLSECA
jgi:transposase